jgi:hypothetical protein
VRLLTGEGEPVLLPIERVVNPRADNLLYEKLRVLSPDVLCILLRPIRHCFLLNKER